MTPPHHTAPELPPASFLLDALDEGALLIDQENRVAWINRTLERLLGIDRNTLLGSDADRFLLRHLGGAGAERITRDDMPPLVCTLRPPDGRECHVSASSAAVREEPFSGMRLVRLYSDVSAARHPAGIERLEFFLQNARDLIYRIELVPQRRFSYVSPSATAITGYTPEEHYQDPGLGMKLVHPDDLPLLDAVARGEIPPDRALTLRWIRKDGSVIWTEQQNVPVYDDAGTLVAIEGIAREVTERKQMEEALQKSEETYRTIVETANEGIWEMDGRYITLRVNHTMAAMLGYSVGEMVGRSVPEFLYEEDFAEHADRMTQRHEGLAGRYECRLKQRDGTARWVLVSATAKRDEDGTFAGSFAMFTDITERKRAEEALKENAARYQQFFNNPLVGYALCRIVTDERGEPVDFIYREVNRAFEVLTGLRRQDVLNRQVTEVLVPGEVTEITRRYGAVALTGEPATFQYSIPSLAKWFEIAAFSPSRGDFIAFFTDITERKRAEEALVRRTEELIRKSEELEAARDEANIYLDIMTHDIRNANTASGMYAALLADLTEGNLKAYAERLHASIDRSTEILMNVATIRRASEDSSTLVPVNLDKVVREEVKNFPNAAIRYDDPKVEVLADALLPVIFMNLIGNAVKFGGPGVTVTVRVEEQDGEVLVSVEDTGPGVPDEVKGKLFRRFERGRAQGSGQGLGLFIVRTLVTRYGGKAWVDDRVRGRPEEGAAFRFTLRKA
ncbi:PAS domain S-box protein [Methanoculleus frigidifontis]|nr:PAS domain S-box protein [Methanoculleus sp. FWC-SCC1]